MTKQAKTPMDRVRNPQGRADWLAAKLLSELSKKDPALQFAFNISRNEVEILLRQVLGPKTATGRKVKNAIQAGRNLMKELATQ